MTSDTRRAKDQLKEQIEESLSDLKAPVLTDHDLIQLLKMPKVKIKIGEESDDQLKG